MKTLDQIAIEHGTDKSSQTHNYCVIYQRYLEHLRYDNNILLELGFGGYNDPDSGGDSLRMWLEYLPNSRVYAIDKCAKNYASTTRSAVYHGGQANVQFLNDVIKKIGQPNIIVDDASHDSLLTMRSFELLFPKLAHGGYYIIEDLQTSYWDTSYNGGLHNPKSTVNVLKNLLDTMHCNDGRGLPSADIQAMCFYNKIVFIHKK